MLINAPMVQVAGYVDKHSLGRCYKNLCYGRRRWLFVHVKGAYLKPLAGDSPCFCHWNKTKRWYMHAEIIAQRCKGCVFKQVSISFWTGSVENDIVSHCAHFSGGMQWTSPLDIISSTMQGWQCSLRNVWWFWSILIPSSLFRACMEPKLIEPAMPVFCVYISVYSERN